jgi:hypothetical protein
LAYYWGLILRQLGTEQAGLMKEIKQKVKIKQIELLSDMQKQ